MPDTDTPGRPQGDADLRPPPADADFKAAAPLKDAGVSFEPETVQEADRPADVRQLVRDNAAKLQGQAADRARAYAEQGKAKAGDALGQLSRMLDDAATQVDDRLGTQYGQYARQAAGQVSGFADAIAAKDVDELADDVRAFVRASPGAALGIAAALGFAVARLVQSGLDDRPR